MSHQPRGLTWRDHKINMKEPYWAKCQRCTTLQAWGRWLISVGALILAVPGLIAGEPSSQGTFTIAMLPDTQHYSRRYHDQFTAQTEWIKANRDRENLVFVTHVGDVVNDRKKDMNQWQVAQQAMSVLDGVVPWGVAIGNHDYDSTACRPEQASAFLEYFGPQRFQRYPWFGGAFTNGLDSCQLFSAGGLDFICFHLELDVPDYAIAWVEGMLKAHPRRAAILTTHSYLNGVSGTNGYNDAVSKHGNSGMEVWNKLVRRQPQVFLVLCGHHQRTVAYHQVSTNAAGGRVVEMLADYQKGHNGGDAWLRLLRFDPAQRVIRVQTYSPSLKAFKTDAQNQFTVPFDLPAVCRANGGVNN